MKNVPGLWEEAGCPEKTHVGSRRTSQREGWDLNPDLLTVKWVRYPQPHCASLMSVWTKKKETWIRKQIQVSSLVMCDTRVSARRKQTVETSATLEAELKMLRFSNEDEWIRGNAHVRCFERFGCPFCCCVWLLCQIGWSYAPCYLTWTLAWC